MNWPRHPRLFLRRFVCVLGASGIGSIAMALATTVQQAEYLVDGGRAQPMPMVATQSMPAYSETEFSGVVPTADLSIGPHWLEVRLQADNGIWSNWHGQWLRLEGETHLIGAEWFVDTDPGPGKAASIPQPADGRWDEAEEDLVVAGLRPDAYSVGRHQLFVRAKDSNGDWGVVSAATFIVEEPLRLVAAEWTTRWNLDVATHYDAQGLAMRASDGKIDSAEETLHAVGITDQLGPLCSLNAVCVRVKDNWGRWSSWHGLTWDESRGQWIFGPALGWAGAHVTPVQVVPQVPRQPFPEDLALVAAVPITLDWADCDGAEHYDVFFWQQGKPRQTVAAGLATSSFAITSPLTPGRAAYWMVRAQAVGGCWNDGPTWVITVPGPGDVDGDGMLDAWENDWFGTTFMADPRTDLDGDGFPDWEEFWALTDATNPRDYFTVVDFAVRQNPGEVVVSWLSAQDRLYSLMSSTNLAAGWKTLYQAEGDGNRQSFTNRFPSPVQQFFQVGVEPKP